MNANKGVSGLGVFVALYTGAAFAASSLSSPPGQIDEAERDKIVSIVMLTDLMTEGCARDHRALKPQIQEAVASWQGRNQKYVAFAHSDPRFESLKKHLLETKASTPDGRIPEAQCKDTIRTMHLPEVDIDSLLARQAKSNQ